MINRVVIHSGVIIIGVLLVFDFAGAQVAPQTVELGE
jgi:hypothetical protein